MKKTITTVGICVALIASLFVTGCTDEQAKVISQNAGLAAAVTWIAYDNPNGATKEMVSQALGIIRENVDKVGDSETYMEVILPMLEEWARSDSVPDQYEPLVLAGSMAALSGIDLLFAVNPNWKVKKSLGVAIVNSFILGAKMGLGLDDTDPLIVEAQRLHVQRSRVFKQ